MNEAIKDVTPTDLYNSINSNQDLWSVTPDEFKRIGGKLKNRFGELAERYKDEINVDLVLAWLKEDRPELYSVIINTNNGVEWLERQVELIKKKIFEEL